MIWLGRLANLYALDFSHFEENLIAKIAINYADFEVEDGFLKKLVPAVILKLVYQRPNFTRF